MRDWLILEPSSEGTELRCENEALHAELAKTRELLDMASLMASQSWQEADAAKKRLEELEKPRPKPKRGAPATVDPNQVFRVLTRMIREIKEPTRRDLSRVMRAAAAELVCSDKRIGQIVNQAMEASGLEYTKRK
jgi:hypothetical protein